MLSSLVEFGDVIIYDWIEILELIMTEISSIDVYLELLLIGSWIDMIWNGKNLGNRVNIAVVMSDFLWTVFVHSIRTREPPVKL